MRMPEPTPFGETSLRAIVRAICSAEPMNVRAGGCVASVVTCRTQRFVDRFVDRVFAITTRTFNGDQPSPRLALRAYFVAYAYGLSSNSILQLCEQK